MAYKSANSFGLKTQKVSNLVQSSNIHKIIERNNEKKINKNTLPNMKSGNQRKKRKLRFTTQSTATRFITHFLQVC